MLLPIRLLNLHVQHTPNPFAQEPEEVPALLVHSELKKSKNYIFKNLLSIVSDLTCNFRWRVIWKCLIYVTSFFRIVYFKSCKIVHKFRGNKHTQSMLECRALKFFSLISSLHKQNKFSALAFYKIIRHVQIQTFDNQRPVILLAIRLQSKDQKHLISGNGLPELQV